MDSYAKKVLQLDVRDNVLIALGDLPAGDSVEFAGKTYPLVSDVPAKHKFATEDLAESAPVVMYGVLVGKATQGIRRGEVLTLRNVTHDAAAFHEKSAEFQWKAPDVSKWQGRKFAGYRRA